MFKKSSHKDFFLSIFIFILLLLLDQLSKHLSISSEISVINKGFIFGIGEGLPASLRIITLSSLFGLIFFIYLSIIYLLPNSLKKLKYFLTIFVSGVSGNVLDRTFRGESIDFIPINIGDWHGPIFNMADSFQWLGAILITYKLIKHEKVIWYPENQRDQFLVNPREQIKFALKMMMVSFSNSVLLGLFGLTFLQTTVAPEKLAAVLFNFTIGLICLVLVFNGVIFYVGLILEHRSSGPLYAFEQYVEGLLQGKRRKLKLREGDNYKHFEKIADDLLKYFIKMK